MNRPITKGYTVEICTKIGRDESGDHNCDLDEHEQYDVRTLAQARKLAKELLPQDQLGEVTITPFVTVYEDVYLGKGASGRVRDKEYDMTKREIVSREGET